ncbi:MAG: hypothetical protein MJ183_05065 [Treponemataceae bacterium]|nr:hypothetical protein [Treponemataceae bacterium]
MSDYDYSAPKKPVARYEPGELERTRQNLGILDPEEAKQMIKTLGGEIGIEKSKPIDESALPKRDRVYVSRRSSGNSAGSGSAGSGSGSSSSDDRSASASFSAGAAGSKPVKKQFSLPSVSAKTKADMDEVMIAYRIKQKYGFFAMILNRALNRTDRIADYFTTNILRGIVQHVAAFAEAFLSLVRSGGPNTEQRLAEASSVPYRMAAIVSDWDIAAIEEEYKKVAVRPADVSVISLVPVVKALYRAIYPLAFLPKERGVESLKTLYNEIKEDSMVSAERLQTLTREAINNWLFIADEAVENLYPLVMRMCCTELESFPDILKSQSSRILSFLGLTKYDVIIPKKEEPKQEEEKPKPEEEVSVINIPPIVQKGLSVLDTLFPQAGWKDISTMPDMYAYYQNIYQFQDGLNYVDPNNPMQIVVVLLRIIEDFFVGCRNVMFRQEMTMDSSSRVQKAQSIFDDFAEYREVLFDRKYAQMLKTFINNIYANSEYAWTQFGKKEMSNILWYAHNQFLPYLRFDLTFIDKPAPDTALPFLKDNIPAVLRFLNSIITQADAAYKDNPEEAVVTETLGAQKLWAPYKFAVPNPISKRLDVLLGGKGSKNATNLNLLKYTASVLAVLNWWINDKGSAAYMEDATIPFRRDMNGKPVFNVNLVPNPNDLFAERLKSMVRAKSEQADQTQPETPAGE